jgi:hypothetical protein
MNRPDGIKADGAAPPLARWPVLWMRKGRHAGQQ